MGFKAEAIREGGLVGHSQTHTAQLAFLHTPDPPAQCWARPCQSSFKTVFYRPDQRQSDQGNLSVLRFPLLR